MALGTLRWELKWKQDILIAIFLGGISMISNRFFGITAIFAYLGAVKASFITVIIKL